MNELNVSFAKVSVRWGSFNYPFAVFLALDFPQYVSSVDPVADFPDDHMICPISHTCLLLASTGKRTKPTAHSCCLFVVFPEHIGMRGGRHGSPTRCSYARLLICQLNY